MWENCCVYQITNCCEMNDDYWQENICRFVADYIQHWIEKVTTQKSSWKICCGFVMLLLWKWQQSQEEWWEKGTWKTSCENDRKYGKTTKAMKSDKNCCEIVGICTRIFFYKKLTKENQNHGHKFLVSLQCKLKWTIRIQRFTTIYQKYVKYVLKKQHRVWAKSTS